MDIYQKILVKNRDFLGESYGPYVMAKRWKNILELTKTYILIKNNNK